MRFVVIVVLVVVSAIGLVWLLQRRLIYFPSSDVPDVRIALPGAEEVVFPTGDGLMLNGWFVPGVDQGFTVIVFNGNAGNRGDRAVLAESFAGRGFGVLLFDYRGYGENKGRPSEEGLVADGLAAASYVENRADVNTDRIVYFGESLGAAVAIATADRHPPSILALRSPFTTLAETAASHYPFLPVSMMLWDHYGSIETIQRVEVPTIVIAGTGDRTIPVDQSRRVLDASPGPKRWLSIDGADHNDAELSDGPMLIEAVVRFAEEFGS